MPLSAARVSSRPTRRVVVATVAFSLAVAASGCGGEEADRQSGAATTATSTGTTTTARARASAAELGWKRQVERFTAGLLPALRSLQELSGGGPTAGSFGLRLDPRLFSPGPQRRAFVSAMDALSRCDATLRANVPPPPTPRLRPVHTALVHACRALEAVPPLLRSEVLTARRAAEVDPHARAAAAARTDEGVRLLVDGLAIQQRVLGGTP